MVVPMAYEIDHGLSQLFLAREAPPIEGSPLKYTEIAFDLIDPRSVLGSVGEREAIALALIEISPTFAWPIEVDIEAVPNDMDFLAWMGGSNLIHETDQVFGFACVTAVGHDLPSVHIECGDQGLGAVALVFKLLTSYSPPRWRARWVFSLKRLHAWLFINAQHHLIWAGLLQLQPADCCDLLTKVGINAVQPLLISMRPDLTTRQQCFLVDIEVDPRSHGEPQ